MASAIAPPAAGSVPEPNSSMRTRVSLPAEASISFMSARKELYVLRSFSSDWSSPMLTIMLLKTGSSEASEVGMSIPHWNMYCSRPTVLRQTDFPPALGPDISRMCFAGVRFTVCGTISRPSFLRDFSSMGWRALRRCSSPSSEMTGIPAM